MIGSNKVNAPAESNESGWEKVKSPKRSGRGGRAIDGPPQSGQTFSPPAQSSTRLTKTGAKTTGFNMDSSPGEIIELSGYSMQTHIASSSDVIYQRLLTNRTRGDHSPMNEQSIFFQKFRIDPVPEATQPTSNAAIKEDMEILVQDMLNRKECEGMRSELNHLQKQIVVSKAGDTEKLLALCDQVVIKAERFIGRLPRKNGMPILPSQEWSLQFGVVKGFSNYYNITLPNLQERMDRGGFSGSATQLAVGALSKLGKMCTAIGLALGDKRENKNIAAGLCRIGWKTPGKAQAFQYIKESFAAISSSRGSLRANDSDLNDALTQLKGENNRWLPFKKPIVAPSPRQGSSRLSTYFVPGIDHAGNKVDIDKADDSEFKILTKLDRFLQEICTKKGLKNEAMEGIFYLASQHPFCASCAKAIAEFQKLWPGILVIPIQMDRTIAIHEKSALEKMGMNPTDHTVSIAEEFQDIVNLHHQHLASVKQDGNTVEDQNREELLLPSSFPSLTTDAATPRTTDLANASTWASIAVSAPPAVSADSNVKSRKTEPLTNQSWAGIVSTAVPPAQEKSTPPEKEKNTQPEKKSKQSAPLFPALPGTTGTAPQYRGSLWSKLGASNPTSSEEERQGADSGTPQKSEEPASVPDKWDDDLNE